MDEHFSYWKRPRLRWLWAGVALMQEYARVCSQEILSARRRCMAAVCAERFGRSSGGRTAAAPPDGASALCCWV